VITGGTEQVQVGATELHLLKGGSGPACLFLHGVEGDEGWLSFHDALCHGFSVYAPSHPGYGRTPAPEWITSVHHQAIFYNWFLQTEALGDVTLVGVGLGGWIATEMAVMCTSRLRRLVLVNPAGLRPKRGEIADIFVMPWRKVIESGFADFHSAPEYERLYGGGIPEYGGMREAGRTMTMRMCFRPYMYDSSLEGMLGKIDLPTLIVRGDHDTIVPAECAERYAQSIPRAELRILRDCGHFAHLDQPDALAEVIGQ